MIVFAIVIAAHSAMALPARVAPAFDTPLIAVALGEDRSETVLSTRRQTLLIQRIQIRLAELGIYEGTIEGEMTPNTSQAIRQYQRLANLPLDGRP
ncbi:MAG: peptidoglycan-binding protein, partial [Alphaproteobacteria bacterium]|nr:peptidoglycan-binding protein [Alphaproteobacteria bacterium]